MIFLVASGNSQVMEVSNLRGITQGKNPASKHGQPMDLLVVGKARSGHWLAVPKPYVLTQTAVPVNVRDHEPRAELGLCC